MPRAVELVAEPYGDILPGRPYAVRVLDVKVKSKSGELHLTIEHAGQEQEGRKQTCILPAKLLPNNVTSQLLKAAGVDVTTGNKVNPANAAGALVLVTFAASARDPDASLMEPIIVAVEAYCTLGEISDVLRGVWGEYKTA